MPLMSASPAAMLLCSFAEWPRGFDRVIELVGSRLRVSGGRNRDHFGWDRDRVTWG